MRYICEVPKPREVYLARTRVVFEWWRVVDENEAARRSEKHWLALETQAAPASNHREGLVTQGCVFQRDSSIQCDTEFWFISNFGQSIYDSWLVTGKVCFPTRAINPTRHSFRDLFRTLGGRNRWYVKILWNLLSIEFEQRRSWIAKGDKTLGSARIEGKGEEKVCVRCRRTVVSSVLAR